MYAVILSGGVGSRLWPVSRKLHPKPFIKASNGLSILQNTFVRAISLNPKGVINVTSAEFHSKILKEWDDLKESSVKPKKRPQFILEPFGNNTAAAIAMASLWVKEHGGEDQLVLVMPSDHIISDFENFSQNVSEAKKLADIGKIVLFGIFPTAAETGYGYIEFSENKVKSFKEKPSIEKAKLYMNSGQYLWNAGIFCFKAQVMLDEMSKYCPDILDQSEKCYRISRLGCVDPLNLDSETFRQIRNESIDFALMEKSQVSSVVVCNMGWSDIGNWSSFNEVLVKDQNGNVINAHAVIEKTKNCYIEGKSRLIAAVGLENMVIIDTPDALLVANKNNAEDVKKIYQSLEESNHQTHASHSLVDTFWGTYQILDEKNGVRVKRIEIDVGKQMGFQRPLVKTLRWNVVSGSARVIVDEKEFFLDCGETILIDFGIECTVFNRSELEPLVVIEIDHNLSKAFLEQCKAALHLGK